MSKELTAFKRHFQNTCSIKVVKTIEESHYPHWKRLAIERLNCEQMAELGWYIRTTFSVEGKFSHKLPTLHEYKGYLCLTVDKSQIQRSILSNQEGKIIG